MTILDRRFPPGAEPSENPTPALSGASERNRVGIRGGGRLRGLRVQRITKAAQRRTHSNSWRTLLGPRRIRRVEVSSRFWSVPVCGAFTSQQVGTIPAQPHIVERRATDSVGSRSELWRPPWIFTHGLVGPSAPPRGAALEFADRAARWRADGRGNQRGAESMEQKRQGGWNFARPRSASLPRRLPALGRPRQWNRSPIPGGRKPTLGNQAATPVKGSTWLYLPWLFK